jgi:hypothetical protein
MKYLKLFESFVKMNELVSSENFDVKKKIENSLKTIKDNYSGDIFTHICKVIKDQVVESMLEFYGIDSKLNELERGISSTKGFAKSNIQDRKKDLEKRIEKFKNSFEVDKSYAEEQSDLYSFWTETFWIYTGLNTNKEMQRQLVTLVDKNKYYDKRSEQWMEKFKDKTDLYVGNFYGLSSELQEIFQKLFSKEIDEHKQSNKDLYFYSKSKMESEDDLAKRIYDWDFTFDTLERIFTEYLDEHASDEVYNKNFDTILDKLKSIENFISNKDYASRFNAVNENKKLYYITEDEDYNGSESSENEFNEELYLTPLDDQRKNDYKYLSNYIGRLSGFCSVNNVIPQNDPFYDMLEELKKWFKNN